jgi:ligand-binding sensor domain-containing protein
VNTIFQSSGGDLWIGVQGGIVKYEVKSNRWTSYSPNRGELDCNNITTIAESADGLLWAKTSTGFALIPGVMSFDGEQWRTVDVLNATVDQPMDSTFTNIVDAMFQGLDRKVLFAVSKGLSSYDGSNWTPIIDLKRWRSKDRLALKGERKTAMETFGWAGFQMA